MPGKPLLLFDAECGFCRRWIARWQHETRDQVEYASYQSCGERFPEIPRAHFARAVHLIEPDGSHTFGAAAVFDALAHGGRRWPLALYRKLPLFAPVTEALYRFVAGHRRAAGGITQCLWGSHVVPPGETRTVSLFLRAMGVIFAVAFLSLWVQVIGLVGEHGILPAREHLEAIRESVGPVRLWLLPTVFWLNASDVALHVVCAAGVLCSLSAVIGFMPAAALFGSWAAYLSLLGVGQDFLRFQWDTLLLEAGMVAVVLAPWRRWLHDAGPPSRPALWLARWLVFRLMVTSAVVKLASGDPTWRHLTALESHYFTQPLPPWTAWYAHLAPEWFQRVSVGAMFAVEGVAPFLIFGPRRVRFVAAGAIAGLQAIIMATGNYGFFNLLTLVLCIPLLDDGLWTRERDAGNPRPASISRAARPVVVIALFLLTLVPFSRALGFDSTKIGPVDLVVRALEPFRLANHYGLFAIMTTERPEIVIEGSHDGKEWKAYEFHYKPGDPMRAPRLLVGHMPRVDWQMWFASLGSVRQNRWFLLLCWRLLQGAPEVRGFFAVDPFPGEPPRYIRANVQMYTFTTAEERHGTGAWWARAPRGPYVQTLMLQDGVLTTAPVMSAP